MTTVVSVEFRGILVIDRDVMIRKTIARNWGPPLKSGVESWYAKKSVSKEVPY